MSAFPLEHSRGVEMVTPIPAPSIYLGRRSRAGTGHAGAFRWARTAGRSTDIAHPDGVYLTVVA
jgi:hypothetical protein